MEFNAGASWEVSDRPPGPDSALASRTPGSQSLKWPLLSKETSPLDLLISRASLAAETPRQIPAVAAPAHSTQEACGQALGALAALPRWGLDMEKLNRAAGEDLQTSQEHTSRASPAGHLDMPVCTGAVSERQESTPQGV